MATAVLAIPTSEGLAFFSQRVTLDGRNYTLHLKWNQREGRWYLSLADDDNVMLAASIKLVSNWALLRYYKHDPRIPPGELVAVDLTPDGAPPGFDELGIGKRVELTYYAQTEQ
jgi:hypothetical protein